MKVHDFTHSIRGAKRLRIVAPKPKVVEPYTGKTKMRMGSRFDLLLFTIALLSVPVLSDLILSKVDRRVSLAPIFLQFCLFNS
jgi:hypothetical protein